MNVTAVHRVTPTDRTTQIAQIILKYKITFFDISFHRPMHSLFAMGLTKQAGCAQSLLDKSNGGKVKG